jgi:hypothetical protein
LQKGITIQYVQHNSCTVFKKLSRRKLNAIGDLSNSSIFSLLSKSSLEALTTCMIR